MVLQVQWRNTNLGLNACMTLDWMKMPARPNRPSKTDTTDSAQLAHGFAILCASRAMLLLRLLERYTNTMKIPSLTILIFAISACSSVYKYYYFSSDPVRLEYGMVKAELLGTPYFGDS